MFRCRVPVVALFLMLAACGGGDNGNPASPSGNNGSGSSPACDDLRSGVFSATVDGSPWNAGTTLPIGGLVAVEEDLAGVRAISIAGNSCDNTSVGFSVPAFVGTREIGDGSGTNAEYSENARDPATRKTWRAIFGLVAQGP